MQRSLCFAMFLYQVSEVSEGLSYFTQLFSSPPTYPQRCLQAVNYQEPERTEWFLTMAALIIFLNYDYQIKAFMQNHNQCLTDFTQHSHFSENHARKTQRAPGFEPRSPSDLDHQALNKVVVSVAVKARALLSNTSHIDFFFPNHLSRVESKLERNKK